MHLHPFGAKQSAPSFCNAAMQGIGNIRKNTFSDNEAKDAGSIYRTGSAGSLAGNKGLSPDGIGEVNPK